MTERIKPSQVTEVQDTCLLCDAEFTATVTDGVRTTGCPSCNMDRDPAKTRRKSRASRVKRTSRANSPTAPRTADPLAGKPRPASRATCPTHGLRHQRLVIDGVDVLSCPDCLRARWYQRIAEEDAREAEQLELAHAQHLTSAGLLGWHACARLEDFQVDPDHSDAQEAVLGAIGEFIDSFRPVGKGLVLIGPSGAGRSFFLAAVVRALIAEHGGGAAVFANPIELADRIRNARDRDPGAGDLEVLEPFLRTRLLAIDDVADVPFHGQELAALDRIVDLRARFAVPTMVSTALEPDALHVALGDRIAGRLLDGSTIVRLTWQSRRRPARELGR